MNRRIHAAQLSYSDGILVCPTNAGAVLGVELLSHSLVWAYSYRESTESKGRGQRARVAALPPAVTWAMRGGMPTQPTTLNNEWRVSAPAIHEGRVVFTAPDGNSIHCVNLKNGSSAWRAPAPRDNDDLFFAGIFHGKALIVGKNKCRALNLVSGTQTLGNWQYRHALRPGRRQRQRLLPADSGRGRDQGSRSRRPRRGPRVWSSLTPSRAAATARWKYPAT